MSFLKVELEAVLFELFLEHILSGEGEGRKPNKGMASGKVLQKFSSVYPRKISRV